MSFNIHHIKTVSTEGTDLNEARIHGVMSNRG